MEGLTFRKAVPGDTNRIAELTAGEPGDEEIGMFGDAEKARKFAMAVVRLPNSPIGWERTVLAELDGKVVGMVQFGSDTPGARSTLWLTYLALLEFGPVGILRLLPRMRARRRVQTKAPEGAFNVSQIDVDPEYRNRGIGAALMEYAEAQARAGGYREMSLSTSTSNPARRLYERRGFRVIETKTDKAFERYTGVEGRLQMAKELD